MDIRVLRYFIAVATQENISVAANALHLSQPTLSRQLNNLEEELGTTLFVRGNRKITLTDEGMFLLDRAKEIVDLIEKQKLILTKNLKLLVEKFILELEKQRQCSSLHKL